MQLYCGDIVVVIVDVLIMINNINTITDITLLEHYQNVYTYV